MRPSWCFRAERAAFATEFIADALVAGNPRSLPSACGPFDGSPLAEWIKSYRTVEDLDFDVIVTGHGPNFVDKALVRETREYFEYLRAEVAAGMAAGQSLEQLKASVPLDALQGLGELRAPARGQRRGRVSQLAHVPVSTRRRSTNDRAAAAGLARRRQVLIDGVQHDADAQVVAHDRHEVDRALLTRAARPSSPTARC